MVQKGQRDNLRHALQLLHICPQVPRLRALLCMSSNVKWNVILHLTTVDSVLPSSSLQNSMC